MVLDWRRAGLDGGAEVVAQHLDNPIGLLEFPPRQLARGGYLAVIDVYDKLKLFRPEVPEVAAMYQAVEKRWQELGHDRHASFKLATAATEHGFRVHSNEVKILHSDRDFQKEDLVRVLSTNSQVIRDAFGASVDPAEVQAALQRWVLAPHSCGTIGIHLLVLERL